MDTHFGLIVRFVLKHGQEAMFDRLVAETVEAIRAHEPGTLIYACHTVDGAANQRIFYELYRDRAAFETHEQQSHVTRFLAERQQHVESFEVDFLALDTAKGVPDGR